MSNMIFEKISQEDLKRLNKGEKIFIDNLKSGIELSVEQDCIYCEGDKKISNHFECFVCGIGMCNECFENQVEHDGHYHRVCENADDDLYQKITDTLGTEPDYICEKCLGNIEK